MKTDATISDAVDYTFNQPVGIAPLAQVTRSHVWTAAAAHYLCCQWEMAGIFVTPIPLNGCLSWPVAAIRAFLKGA